MSLSWSPTPSGLDPSVTMDTKCTSSLPADKQSAQDPVTVPIYHTSTYKIKNVEEYQEILESGGHIYARLGNPTVTAAETLVNDLEEGAGTLLFSSGMAAISTAFYGALSSGDHVIICNPVYSGTHTMADRFLRKFGVEVTFVDAKTVDDYEKEIKKNTKLMFIETPRNPGLEVFDLQGFAELGAKHKILTMNDGTFASPYLQKSIKYGIDISMHSCTKYLGGHSDLIGGSLTFKDVQQWKKFKQFGSTMGAIMNPWEASLLMRGIKTLHLRMDRICDNAQKLAELLDKHPKVDKVFYPGLPNHPGHDIAKRQMSKFGGMISFELKGGLKSGKTFVESVRVIVLAVSLGGVESLVEHPASMTHGPMLMSDEARKEAHISDGLIRLSVGCESVGDLEDDLLQALTQVE